MFERHSSDGVTRLRGLARVFYALLVVGAAAVLAWRVPRGVETDLYGLLDSEHRTVAGALAANLAGQMRFLAEADTPEAAAAALAPFGRAPDVKDTLRHLSSRKAGLLAPETRAALAAGKFAEVAEASAARLFGFGTPLFPVKDDPFLLATEWALALEGRAANGWTMRDGLAVRFAEGRHWALLTREAADADESLEILARVRAANAAAPAKGARIWVGGAPFHAAVATAKSRREINVLSAISLVCVLVFGWCLFRSVRFVPGLLVALAAGALVAGAAVFGVWARPHVLTFVFGTSLIGLSVDYVYHARAAGGAARVARPLLLAALTTTACFAPLLFSRVSVLNQMALFTIAGLVTVLVGTFLFSGGGAGSRAEPDEGDCPRADSAVRWPFVVLAIVLGLGAGLGILRVRFGTDLAAFYRPEAELAAGEATFARLNQSTALAFRVVEGANAQAALEREEELGLKGLSSVVPSLKRQRDNTRLVAELRRVQGRAYAEKTGLRAAAAQVTSGDYLDVEQIDDPLLASLVRTQLVKTKDRAWTVTPVTAAEAACAALPPGVRIVAPRAALEETFESCAAETRRLLGVSFAVLVPLLVLALRRRFLACALPVAAAAAATLGVLGWLGERVNFFHALCFFTFIGLGIDYAIFHLGAPARATRRAVRYSFLTSFVGFGLLAFTDFAVTRSMGVTLGCGLAFAYAFAAVFARRGRTSAAGETPTAWHEQKEQSAGRLRLACVWWVYAHLGKRTARVLVFFVMLFIWPFARPARRALAEFHAVLKAADPAAWRRRKGSFRHLLGFAWALLDKTDACTLRRDLPTITARADAGWAALEARLAAGKGAFIVSTHVGTIEVMPAARGLGGYDPPVHAFQQLGHDAEFTRAFLAHFDSSRLVLHAVESIGVETAVEMQEAIAGGALVVMAGDRPSAASPQAVRHARFLGRDCTWPKGVFVFAKLMDAPVFFATCVKTGSNAYELHFAAADAARDLLGQYVAFLETETRAHPDQWYHFHRFFAATQEET